MFAQHGPALHQPFTRVLREGASSILTTDQAARVAAACPYRLREARWEKLYDLREHGADICTFYERVNGGLCCFTTHGTRYHAEGEGGKFEYVPARGPPAADPQVIVVEDARGRVFGGLLASEHWRPSRRYFGNGESFVFSFAPDNNNDGAGAGAAGSKKFRAFRWQGANDFVAIGRASFLAMGGGADGFAFRLDENFETGTSARSATFGNAVLSSSAQFDIMSVEVYALRSGGL